jgi:hypothetical protein
MASYQPESSLKSHDGAIGLANPVMGVKAMTLGCSLKGSVR